MDSSAVLRSRYSYALFGKRTAVTELTPVSFGFTGHFLHQNSLHLTPFRSYDVDTGNWLSRDPAGESVGLNLYGYVGNDPVNLVDPLGLFTASFGRAWIAQVHEGRDMLMTDSSGFLPIAWNTLVGSLATLGEGIPDALLFGDATGTVSGNPCATAGDMGLALLQDGLRGATIASTAGAGLGRLANGASTGLRTAQEAGISAGDALRIQNAANRTGQEITVIGSRARGAPNPNDWDYILSGPSSARHSASSSLPRGNSGGAITASGRESGIDVFQSYNPNAPGYKVVDPKLPHVIFRPQP